MTTSSIALRPVVRQVMQTNPSRRWSEAALVTCVRTVIPDAKPLDVQSAVVWNQGKGYLASSYDDEMECDLWSLTDAGKAKAA